MNNKNNRVSTESANPKIDVLGTYDWCICPNILDSCGSIPGTETDRSETRVD